MQKSKQLPNTCNLYCFLHSNGRLISSKYSFHSRFLLQSEIATSETGSQVQQLRLRSAVCVVVATAAAALSSSKTTYVTALFAWLARVKKRRSKKVASHKNARQEKNWRHLTLANMRFCKKYNGNVCDSLCIFATSF